ncbi:hypothetical protein MRX96_043430 [Rhipicephalus microplus]
MRVQHVVDREIEKTVRIDSPVSYQSCVSVGRRTRARSSRTGVAALGTVLVGFHDRIQRRKRLTGIGRKTARLSAAAVLRQCSLERLTMDVRDGAG